MYLGPKRAETVEEDREDMGDSKSDDFKLQNYTFYRERNGSKLYFMLDWTNMFQNHTLIEIDLNDPNYYYNGNIPKKNVQNDSVWMITNNNMEVYKKEMVVLFLAYLKNNHEKSFKELKDSCNIATDSKSVPNPNDIFTEMDDYSEEIKNEVNTWKEKYENIQNVVNDYSPKKITQNIQDDLDIYVTAFKFDDYVLKIEKIVKDRVKKGKDALEKETKNFKSEVDKLKRKADAEVAAREAEAKAAREAAVKVANAGGDEVPQVGGDGAGGDGEVMDEEEVKVFLSKYSKQTTNTDISNENYLKFNEETWKRIISDKVKWIYIGNAKNGPENNPYTIKSWNNASGKAKVISTVSSFESARDGWAYSKLRPAKKQEAAVDMHAVDSDVKSPSEEEPRKETPPAGGGAVRGAGGVAANVAGAGGAGGASDQADDTVNSTPRVENTGADFNPIFADTEIIPRTSEGFSRCEKMMKDFTDWHNAVDPNPGAYVYEEDVIDEQKKLFLDMSNEIWLIVFKYGPDKESQNVVGFAQCQRLTQDHFGKTMNLDKLWIVPQYKKPGMGEHYCRASIKKVIQNQKENGSKNPFSKIHAMVIYKNLEALLFFNKKFNMSFNFSKELIDGVSRVRGGTFGDLDEDDRDLVYRDKTKTSTPEQILALVKTNEDFYKRCFDKIKDGVMRDMKNGQDFNIAANVSLNGDILTFENCWHEDFNNFIDAIRTRNNTTFQPYNIKYEDGVQEMAKIMFNDNKNSLPRSITTHVLKNKEWRAKDGKIEVVFDNKFKESCQEITDKELSKQNKLEMLKKI